MRPLSAADMLDLWEHGRRSHPIDRALLMLATALPDAPFDRLADLSIGRRDAALLAVRVATFGKELHGYTDCPACGERLEFTLDGRALELPTRAEAPVAAAGLLFRLPTSRDLAIAITHTDPEWLARRLAESCALSEEDKAVPREYPEAILGEIEMRMMEADPQSDLVLEFACDACRHEWTTAFDIGEFFWEEIAAHATRLLLDVHLLARAYGWTELEVLALSDVRRAAYIDMVSA
jgi:hypothetical protein